jgi:hypothetical protein
MSRESKISPEYRHYLEGVVTRQLPEIASNIVKSDYKVFDIEDASNLHDVVPYHTDLMRLAVLEHKYGDNTDIKKRFLCEVREFGQQHGMAGMAMSTFLQSEYYVRTGRAEKALEELQYAMELIDDYTIDESERQDFKRPMVVMFAIAAIESDEQDIAVNAIESNPELFKEKMSDSENDANLIMLLVKGRGIPQIVNNVSRVVEGTGYYEMYQRLLIMKQLVNGEISLDQAEEMTKGIYNPAVKVTILTSIAHFAQQRSEQSVVDR